MNSQKKFIIVPMLRKHKRAILLRGVRADSRKLLARTRLASTPESGEYMQNCLANVSEFGESSQNCLENVGESGESSQNCLVNGGKSGESRKYVSREYSPKCTCKVCRVMHKKHTLYV